MFKALFSVYMLLVWSHMVQAQNHPLTIMTWNIRYNNPDDGDDRWDLRKEGVVQLIDSVNPSFLGIQEALPGQMTFLQSQMPQYHYIGMGREAGGQGEFAAIFYDTTFYQLDKQSTFWLSTTPLTVSIGWDAALPRICTFGSFMNRKDSSFIWVFNAHFDHVGEMARTASSRLILDTITSVIKDNPKAKIVLMGDFNAEFNSLAIQEMVEKLSWDGDKVQGPYGTFNGFDVHTMPTKRIDYIFTKEIKVLEYYHLDVRLENNHYPSDHLPVVISVER